MQKRFEGSSQDDQNLSALFLRSSRNLTDRSRNFAFVFHCRSVQTHCDPVCAQSSRDRNLCDESKRKIGGKFFGDCCMGSTRLLKRHPAFSVRHQIAFISKIHKTSDGRLLCITKADAHPLSCIGKISSFGLFQVRVLNRTTLYFSRCFGHRPAASRTHCAHFGERAVQVSRPCKTRR